LTEKNFAVNHPVKQSNESVLLLRSFSSKGLTILCVIANGGTSKDAAKQARCSKQNVSYWIGKFKKLGLIRLTVTDVFKLYELTSYGQTVFTTSGEPMVFEDFPLKFEILRHETKDIAWEKLGDPLNWEKLGVKLGGVRVEKNLGKKPHIIIHSGQVFGCDVDGLRVDVGRIIENVRSILCNEFGMVLSDVGVPIRKPTTQFYSKEAKQFHKKLGNMKFNEVTSLDDSPPSPSLPRPSHPHLEFSNEEKARNWASRGDNIVRMLNDVTVMNQKIDSLTEVVNNMVISVGRLTDTLSKLLAPQDSGENRNPPIPKSVYE
jgi:hypothetical protein